MHSNLSAHSQSKGYAGFATLWPLLPLASAHIPFSSVLYHFQSAPARKQEAFAHVCRCLPLASRQCILSGDSLNYMLSVGLGVDSPSGLLHAASRLVLATGRHHPALVLEVTKIFRAALALSTRKS